MRLLLALFIALPVSAATVIYEDGTQVEIPDSWDWSVNVNCTQVTTDVPVECSVYPYAPQCPGSCDGPTPHFLCFKEPAAEPPTGNPCDGPNPNPRCRKVRQLVIGG